MPTSVALQLDTSSFNEARTGYTQQSTGGYVASRLLSVDARTGEVVYVIAQVAVDGALSPSVMRAVPGAEANVANVPLPNTSRGAPLEPLPSGNVISVNGSRFTPDPNIPVPVSIQAHIINGNANGSKASGAHWSGSPNVQVDMTTAVRDPNGVFVANVKVADGNGNFVPKNNAPRDLKTDTGLSNPSTFFPQSWTPERILNEISVGAQTMGPNVSRKPFTTPSGVTILITKVNGKVVTAYPRWPQ
jgi:Bacterial EndoU nuclease